MELNNFKPAEGSKHVKRRVGRGIGSGLGKPQDVVTKARSLVRVVTTRSVLKAVKCLCSVVCPSAVSSRVLRYTAEINLSELAALNRAEVDLLALKEAGLVGQMIKTVKLINSGEIKSAVKLSGIGVTAGAKAALEAAGGKVVQFFRGSVSWQLVPVSETFPAPKWPSCVGA